ncbi:hypothetical protein HYH03_010276 [Edaphochlamys debaryana]|uniref:Uncharacterized protein n=1 Tax=Edaphochlamys debaryana TaxID=47281 RepID=A0A835Y579_9CHLO|nr:hypothetical protein HYH03_010276 [Edaphochlamys debaryana]|eukprot:KAG2491269.1 hypothetical protein HYH03_010276 [Edaphochlamys debaryana]
MAPRPVILPSGSTDGILTLFVWMRGRAGSGVPSSLVPGGTAGNVGFTGGTLTESLPASPQGCKLPVPGISGGCAITEKPLP